MSKSAKLLFKLSNSRNTFPFTELVTLLTQLGYTKNEMAGSRVRFFNSSTNSLILLHKPHPSNEIKGGALKSIKLSLKKEGLL